MFVLKCLKCIRLTCVNVTSISAISISDLLIVINNFFRYQGKSSKTSDPFLLYVQMNIALSF